MRIIIHQYNINVKTYFNMRTMYETMSENLFIIAIRGPSDSEVRDLGIGGQGGDELWGPVRGDDYSVIVHLYISSM